jgi:hypothetical protein
MKKVSFQLEDINGKIIEEVDMEISDGDKLIIKVLEENIDDEMLEMVHSIMDSFKTDAESIAIPHYIEINVLRVKRE